MSERTSNDDQKDELLKLAGECEGFHRISGDDLPPEVSQRIVAAASQAFEQRFLGRQRGRESALGQEGGEMSQDVTTLHRPDSLAAGGRPRQISRTTVALLAAAGTLAAALLVTSAYIGLRGTDPPNTTITDGVKEHDDSAGGALTEVAEVQEAPRARVIEPIEAPRAEEEGKGDATIAQGAKEDDDPAARTRTPAEVVKAPETNQAPVIQPVPEDQWVEAGVASEFAVKAIDPDGPANQLTYTLVGAPGWARIDPAVGKITLTPTAAQAGSRFPLNVRVIDNGQPAPSFAETTINVVVAQAMARTGKEGEGPAPLMGPEAPTPSTAGAPGAPSPAPGFPPPSPPSGFPQPAGPPSPAPSPRPGFPPTASGYPPATPGVPQLTYPTPAPLPQDPTLKTITLDLDKKITAYDLEADPSLMEGDLYVELLGPESWPMPAAFVDGKNRISLRGKTTIKWEYLEGPEISIKFLRYPDALRLQVESVVRQGAKRGRDPAFTREEVESWKNNLPQELAQAVAEYSTLQVVGPQLRVRLGQLQADYQRAVRSRNPSDAGKAQTAMRNCQNDLKRAGIRFENLEDNIPRMQAIVAALPHLEKLAKSLHRKAKLYYRISAEEEEK